MLDEVISFLITVFGVAIGMLLFNIIWHMYGRLKLEKKAYVTIPTVREPDEPEVLSLSFVENESRRYADELHHYVKVVVRNDSKKAFEDVKPVITLKGRGRASYIQGNPYYEFETQGELCWAGLESSVKTIYPGEVAYIDLFRVVRPEGRDDLRAVILQMPSENGWARPRSFVVRVNGEPREPSNRIVCELFLWLEWEAELKLLSKNGRAETAKLAIDSIKRALRDNLMTKEFEIIQEV